jgi:hypothetical protein
MQSYLQYRKLGRRLRAQVEYNRQKEEALESKEDGTTANRATPNDEGSDPADPDFSRPGSSVDIELGNPRPTIERTETLRTVGTQLGISLTGIDVRGRRTAEGKHLGKVFVVGYEGSEDPMNPHNWSLRKRIFVTVNIGIIALVVGIAASIDSAAIPQASAEFGVSDVTEALATGLVSRTPT